VLVSEEGSGFELVAESVALVSAAVVVASVSVLDDPVVLGRGSKENVGLPCGTETVVVFWVWLAAGSCGDEDSTTCGGTDTVMYVVDVLVTVPICASPNVQKDVGGPLVRLLHGVEEVPSLPLASEPIGWYENDAARVTAAGGISLSARAVELEATGIAAGVSASCENGSVVMPWMAASESEGLPAYGR
jgi:hypothetical protein